MDFYRFSMDFNENVGFGASPARSSVIAALPGAFFIRKTALLKEQKKT